ncbi:MAG: glycosyl transferase [Lachnospiraceae bacterium]|nr:glycosyl transferase [Lachnospiraceae bacterium]
MVSTFCTLFDSKYLDKGLALYWSMQQHIVDFKLYIFAFDDKSYEVLSELQLENVIVIPLKDIMTTTLRKLQEERTRAEFCWTCTPIVIEYVLLKCKEKICTYIDADIYFFANPNIVIQELLDARCSVGIVRHGFERNYRYGELIFKVGKYCVEFNTFLNNRESLQVLEKWKTDCMNWCYYRCEDGKLGDQKYLDQWRLEYSCVHESQNLGAGVAPWNLHLYTLLVNRKGNIWMQYKDKRFKLIFYHFEGMKYLSNGRIHLGLWDYCKVGTGKKVKLLYGQYLKKIKLIRGFLASTYGIDFEDMVADKKQVLGKESLIKQFVMADGLFQGFSRWIGYRHNGSKKG